MRLTDDQIRDIRDEYNDWRKSQFLEYYFIPCVYTLATEVLESRAEIARLTKERDEARGLVIEANNSLFGSQGYFHSTSGGDYDRLHLAKEIEKLKSSARERFSADARVAELEASLDVDRLEEIITDSIDLDWTPRTAAKAIVRAMKGARHE